VRAGLNFRQSLAVGRFFYKFVRSLGFIADNTVGIIFL